MYYLLIVVSYIQKRETFTPLSVHFIKVFSDNIEVSICRI